ncbi:uncharacterized protein LOC125035006 [Penaeus chinensis]|uniref:uncharacterized protein LOC125035006 n=1 Tax=Penaeus chinensis TaxID=139456 RepID=UPI001FB803F0|nr:uncharacterized protein LOC125035006 [Penaeus chinensis]
MSLVDILEKAQALGLSADVVHDLLEKQHQIDKDKADRLERSAERETRRLELEYNEAERRRAHELELAKIKHSSSKELDSNSRSNSHMFEGLRLPTFADGQDDLDSYLQRFERLAELHGWKHEDYHVYLGTSLRGQALKVYISLPDETLRNYERLKEALLRAFAVDADSYRRKFRESKCKENESYVQLVVKMEQYLDRWLSMSNVEKDYARLFDFLIREQLLTNCSSDLRVFLKERGCESATEMAEAADRYRSAHAYRGSKLSRPVQKQSSPNSDDIKCHGCGKPGHIRPNCPSNPRNFKQKTEGKVNFVFQSEMKPQNSIIDAEGKLFEKPAEVMFDTGCSTVIVNDKLVPARFRLGPMVKVYDYLGVPNSFPKVRCFIQSKFFSGWISAIAAPLKFADVLIGLVPGVKLPSKCATTSLEHEQSKDVGDDASQALTKVGDVSVGNDYKIADKKDVNESPDVIAMSVQTRSSISKVAKITSLACSEFLDLNINKDQIREEQLNCPTLQSIRENVKSGKRVKVKSRAVKFEIIGGLIYRVCLESKYDYEIGSKQLVTPDKYRIHVLNLAHDSLTAGHFSHRKTSFKVFSKFFWPGAGAHIKRYCRSCPICQKFSAKGTVRKVPMKNLPIISEPFSRVAIDLVGPFSPCSERGNKYVLTLIDYATRYPEAVPLKNIDTVTVAESLVEIFSRVGVPREILSDRGSQFKSDLMSEIHRMLSVKALYTSPYHASCNGAVERLNGVLKSMIKKLCVDHPKDWDRYIPAALFAYREIPNDSLKFSPFELLYGRQIRGPLTILHELWTKDDIDSDVKTTYQYVLDLRSRLEETAKLAAAQAEISSRNYKSYYDLKAKHRKLNTGEEVLVLLPSSSNKLIMQWLGPYPVVQCKDNGVDYVIRVRGVKKLFHINMLKRYFRRDSYKSESEIAQVCIVEEENQVGDNCEPVYFDTEGISNINFGNELTKIQIGELKGILSKFTDVLTVKPGLTNTIKHVINILSSKPVHKKPYPIPNSLVNDFNTEIDKMLVMNIIEPSTSAFSSPVVMVKKSDGSWRICIDFRALNDVTDLDAEPKPNTEEALGKFVNDIYFTEVDLCRGYWQIPLSKDSKMYTAFATYRGLMQFRVMPFGLKSACATFIRLMRKVVSELKNTDCYFDNIVIHNNDWSEHLQDVKDLLLRLRKHGLTASLSKCFFGFSKIKYLGVLLGDNCISPLESKINAILAMPLPVNKKQLRSFIGTIGYYRKFVPNFASIAAPLHDLLKKNSSNRLQWSEEKAKCFNKLKLSLVSKPVLCLPDDSKTFYVRTDASDIGLGAVLLQNMNEINMPICYASRKLLDREAKYAAIEKECLAIVWAIQKFKVYLYGRDFILQTDQQPLVYLKNMKNTNGRLMRWALALQCYSFTVEYIKGSENVGADILSRCPLPE